MKLSKIDIQHIADLSRLNLSEEELEKYGQQLSTILFYIEQLNEVNTEKVEPTTQVTGLENILRDDVVKNWNKEEISLSLKLAPFLEDEQIKVKRVLE